MVSTALAGTSAIDGRAGGCHDPSMRVAPPALGLGLLVLVLAAPGAAGAAEAYRKLVIEVGEKVVIGGYTGMCDDPSVATITLDARATITAVRVGTTLCSSRVTGQRQIFRVVVEPKAKPTAR